jgi:hypothetical protein
VRYPVSKTGGPLGLGGSTPSPSACWCGRLEAWPSQVRQRVASAQAGDRPQVRILLPPFNRSGVVERQDARLLIAKRRFESCRRSCLTLLSLAPVVEVAMTPGPQPGSCGFESRRGYSMIVFWL